MCVWGGSSGPQCNFLALCPFPLILQECFRGCWRTGIDVWKGPRLWRLPSLGRESRTRVPGPSAPYNTLDLSLSHFSTTVSQPGCQFPSPKAAVPARPWGRDFPGRVTPPAVGRQWSRQRFLCWPVLPRHELQGFSAVASRASSQRL